jgi:acyl carrier protein
MNPATLEDTQRRVVAALVDVAPDLEGEDVAPDADLRQDLGLDSMDFVNLVTILSEQLGDDIPEADYSLLETVESCAAYLHERAAST